MLSGLAVALAALGGCSLDVAAESELPGQVIIVNTAAAVNNVSVYFNGNPLAVVPYPGTSQCVTEPAGSSAYTFSYNGLPLTALSLPINGKAHYTILFANNGTKYRAAALGDDGTLTANQVGIRLINASSAPGDVYIMPPGDAPSTTNRAASNIQLFSNTDVAPGFTVRPPSDSHVLFFDVGSTTNPRADFTLSAINSSRLTTIIFVDKNAASDPGAFQVDPCNTVIQ